MCGRKRWREKQEIGTNDAGIPAVAPHGASNVSTYDDSERAGNAEVVGDSEDSAAAIDAMPVVAAVEETAA